MKKLYLSFLWHQHQPYYKNDSEGRYYMPWVYLHALKDYYEMAAHVETTGVRAVFLPLPDLPHGQPVLRQLPHLCLGSLDDGRSSDAGPPFLRPVPLRNRSAGTCRLGDSLPPPPGAFLGGLQSDTSVRTVPGTAVPV